MKVITLELRDALRDAWEESQWGPGVRGTGTMDPREVSLDGLLERLEIKLALRDKCGHPWRGRAPVSIEAATLCALAREYADKKDASRGGKEAEGTRLLRELARLIDGAK